MLAALVFLCCLAFSLGQNAFYSINYYPGKKSSHVIANSNQIFTAPPSTQQVADICARISGQRPLLWEDKANLPTRSLDSQSADTPFLLEVHGGDLPMSVQSVIRTTAYDVPHDQTLPSLNEVLTVLQSHGIKANGQVLQNQGDAALSLSKYLKDHPDQPLIILHYEAPTASHFLSKERLLLASSSNSTVVVPLTEQEISQYQICLWTGVMFVLLLLASVCAIVKMEVIPDSLLYAKFQSSRTEGKRD